MFLSSYPVLYKINRTNVRYTLYFLKVLWYTILLVVIMFELTDSIQSIEQRLSLLSCKNGKL